MTEHEALARNARIWLAGADTRALGILMECLAVELDHRRLPGIATMTLAAHRLSLYATAQEAARAAEPMYSTDCTRRSE